MNINQTRTINDQEPKLYVFEGLVKSYPKNEFLEEPAATQIERREQRTGMQIYAALIIMTLSLVYFLAL